MTSAVNTEEAIHVANEYISSTLVNPEKYLRYLTVESRYREPPFGGPVLAR
jgi:hypothetical protein